MNLKRAEQDSPSRCKSNLRGDQCPYESVEGSNHCELHGGNRARDKQSKERLKNLNLSLWKASIANQASSENIFSLRDEIGVVRMLLEQVLNSCKTESELMQRSQTIQGLLNQTNNLVSSCYKIESALGEFLSQEQLASIADRIISIISEYVDDEEHLLEITEQIINTCKDES